MQVFSEKKLSLFKIWQNSWVLFQKTLPKTIILSLLIGVLSSFQVYIVDHLKQSINQIHGNNWGWVLFWLKMAITLLVIVFLAQTILYRIYYFGNSQYPSWQQSFKDVGKKFANIIMAFILIAFILFISALLITFFALIIWVLFVGMPINIFQLREIMLLCAVITMILIYILYAFFYFTGPSILFDNKGIFGAIVASIKLVWHNWWRTFGAILPLTFLVFTPAIVLKLISNNSTAFLMLINVIFGTFYLPVAAAVILVLFNDLKIRKGL